MLECYRTFLDLELRVLNQEIGLRDQHARTLRLDNRAGNFHEGDAPPPSSRAATVLGLFGLLPENGEATAEASAA